MNSMPDSLPLCLPDKVRTRTELRRYFGRLGLVDECCLGRAIDRVQQSMEGLDGVPPTAAATRAVTTWVSDALGVDLTTCLPDSVAPRAAMAAVVLSDCARRWPEHFLAECPAPDALRETLRASLVLPVPRLLPLSMPEQSLAPLGASIPRLPGWGLPAEQRS